MNDERCARRFLVSGVVQGVGYRFFAQRTAEQLGLTGYTKNLRDGRVEVYAIGSKKVLADLRRQLERGPAAAEVSEVRESDALIERRFEGGFSIEYDL